MARTLFPDILSAYKLDIKNEINKLHQLFFIDTFKISETIYPLFRAKKEITTCILSSYWGGSRK